MARTTIAMERWMVRTPVAAVAEGYRRSSWTPKGTAFTGMDGMKVIALFAEKRWTVS
jgi:membrane-bound lytic murein transglycosylase MltF